MQQVALPSLYAPRKGRAQTTPFPLVRRQQRVRRSSTRKFVAGLLFGVLMSMTLVLLGYAARVYFDTNPGAFQQAVDKVKTFDW